MSQDKYDKLVDEYKRKPRLMFPFTVRELALRFGISKSEIGRWMKSDERIYAEGHRWFYREDKNEML